MEGKSEETEGKWGKMHGMRRGSGKHGDECGCEDGSDPEDESCEDPFDLSLVWKK